MHINHIELTPILIWKLDGVLLGDGSFEKRLPHGQKSPSARFTTFSKYKNLMIGLANDLESYELNSKIYLTKYKSNFGNKNGKIMSGYGWSLRSKYYRELKEQHKRWYQWNPNKQWGKNKGRYVKNIPHDIVLSPTTLLYWWLGDGSIGSSRNNPNSGSMYISADSFRKDELETMTQKLEKQYSIRTSIVPVKREKGIYNHLNFNAYSRKVFFDIIGLCPNYANDLSYRWGTKCLKTQRILLYSHLIEKYIFSSISLFNRTPFNRFNVTCFLENFNQAIVSMAIKFRNSRIIGANSYEQLADSIINWGCMAGVLKTIKKDCRKSKNTCGKTRFLWVIPSDYFYKTIYSRFYAFDFLINKEKISYKQLKKSHPSLYELKKDSKKLYYHIS